MRSSRLPAAALCLFAACFATRSDFAPGPADWLVERGRWPARAVESRGRIVLENGLIRREIALSPDAATVAFDDLMTGAALIRGPRAEARLVVGGVRLDIGGLAGQRDHAFLLPEWVAHLRALGDLRCTRHRIGPTRERFPWKRRRHSEDRPWPPPGVALELDFRLVGAAEGALRARIARASGPGALGGEDLDSTIDRLRGIVATIRYELYDGIPLIGKELIVRNEGSEPVRIDSFTSEILAAVEDESIVETPPQRGPSGIDVVCDYAFGGRSPVNGSLAVRWLPDPDYSTQVNYRKLAPVLLEVGPLLGPAEVVPVGGSFRSFCVFELVQDSTDRERVGLARRRAYRLLAPWVTENPLMMHVRSADPAAVRAAIDQCAEVGFEMAILTFGSGFDIEDDRPETLARYRALADYAHSRGIEIGGYGLLASRRISEEHDVVDRETGETGHAFFGNSPCLCSAWGEDYFRKLVRFFETTSFDMLEHDGSYPGDPCASTKHPGHSGYEDSRWRQWTRIRDFYRWCRGHGIFLNVPDNYFLCGSNKSGMGYRETNWSLPRELQPLHGRQNVFDGTWDKTPTMGWMFVPLTEYHGGGAAATLEPLSEHADAYEQHLAYNFGFGVQACWRGPRLYDGPKTKALVAEWVSFYRRHRAILESDLIHLRRADGRDLDGMLHVNPKLDERALLMVFNPLDRPLRRRLRVPLHYAGLVESARVRGEDGVERIVALDRFDAATLEVEVPPRGRTYCVFREP
ncbi:MAG: hypothetical protein Fur0037_08770 [Planctomycetota bacterium]